MAGIGLHVADAGVAVGDGATGLGIGIAKGATSAFYGAGRAGTAVGLGIARACVVGTAAIMGVAGPNRASEALWRADSAVASAHDRASTAMQSANARATGKLTNARDVSASSMGGARSTLQHLAQQDMLHTRIILGNDTAEVLLKTKGLISEFGGPLSAIPKHQLYSTATTWASFQRASRAALAEGSVAESHRSEAKLPLDSERWMRFAVAAYGARSAGKFTTDKGAEAREARRLQREALVRSEKQRQSVLERHAASIEEAEEQLGATPSYRQLRREATGVARLKKQEAKTAKKEARSAEKTQKKAARQGTNVSVAEGDATPGECIDEVEPAKDVSGEIERTEGVTTEDSMDEFVAQCLMDVLDDEDGLHETFSQSHEDDASFVSELWWDDFWEKSNREEQTRCSTVNCTREAWNGETGQTCCRGCLRSSGRKHGPSCNKKSSLVSKPSGDAFEEKSNREEHTRCSTRCCNKKFSLADTDPENPSGNSSRKARKEARSLEREALRSAKTEQKQALLAVWTREKQALAGVKALRRKALLEAKAQGKQVLKEALAEWKTPAGCAKQAMVCAGLDPEGIDVILFEEARSPPAGEPQVPGQLVVVDHSRGCVVVALRGSGGFRDALVDLDCKPEAITLGNIEGLAHGGMLRAAQKLLEPLAVAVEEALSKMPDAPRRVLVLGHSLGAGVGALLTALWHDSGRLQDAEVRCLVFACPQVLDACLAKMQADHTTVLVHGDDCVPCLSWATCLDLRDALVVVADPSRSWPAGEVENQELQAAAYREIREIVDSAPGRLFPAGKLIKHEIGQPPFHADHSMVNEMLVTTDMVFAHMPGRYLASIIEVAAAGGCTESLWSEASPPLPSNDAPSPPHEAPRVLGDGGKLPTLLHDMIAVL